MGIKYLLEFVLKKVISKIKIYDFLLVKMLNITRNTFISLSILTIYFNIFKCFSQLFLNNFFY